MSHGTAQGLPKARDVGLRRCDGPQAGRLFWKRNGLVGLPRADHIQSGVDGRPAQIALDVFERIRIPAPAKQAQENGLQHIFRVSGVAGNPVRRPEHKAVMDPKGSLEFVGNRDRRFL